MHRERTILYCNCSYKELIPEERKRKAREVLEEADAEVMAVPDLCALAAQRDSRLADFAAQPGSTIVACYPRAIRWLFRWAGHPLREDTEIVNLRTSTIRDLAERLDRGRLDRVSPSRLPSAHGARDHAEPSSSAPSPADALAASGDWVPWFPIIDYDKCTSCKQCLSFCPFGVYSQSDDGKVIVTEPRNCKNNCPACARVCPAVAIIFPKVIDSPINGADVSTEDLEQAKVRIEEQKRELAEKGIHSVLAQRKLRALARRMAAQYTREAVEEGT